MTNKDIRLELKFWGSILGCHVYLDDNEIGGWDYDKAEKTRFKELEAYHIDDSFDVKIVARGKNGASVKLNIIIEGQESKQLEGVIEGGVTQVYKSIPVQ